MSNERKQIDRNVEQDRDPRPKRTTTNTRDEQPKRLIDWDDEFGEEAPRLRKSSGRFTERFHEGDED